MIAAVCLSLIFAQAPAIESGAIGDGIRERIERRREERPEPKPVHIEELDGEHPAERKPRPILKRIQEVFQNLAKGITRAFQATMGIAESVPKIVLGYYLTLGTVVFAFTCGVVNTFIRLRARRVKK